MRRDLLTFQYTDPLHPSAVTSQNGKNYTYDPNGNMLAAGLAGSQRTFTWNFENRLESISSPGGGTTTFEYNYTGARVEKSGPFGTVLYPFKGYEIAQGTIFKYIKIGIETYTLRGSLGTSYNFPVKYYLCDTCSSSFISL